MDRILFKQIIFYASWCLFPLVVYTLWKTVRAFKSRHKMQAVCGVLLSVLWFLGIYVRFIEPKLLIVRETSLQVGIKAKIALISDLHIGLFKDTNYLQRIVDTINELDVDYVMIAGDLTYESSEPLDTLLAPLKQLKHPTYSVPGNHDEEMPGPPIQKELRETLLRLNIKPIEENWVELPQFILVGLGDHWAHKDYLKPLLNSPNFKPKIILAHQPDSAIQIPKGSAQLMLVGHTHGGQCNLPIATDAMLRTATTLGVKRGYYALPNVNLFVTSGTGEIGLPIRCFMPPQIDVLILN